MTSVTPTGRPRPWRFRRCPRCRSVVAAGELQQLDFGSNWRAGLLSLPLSAVLFRRRARGVRCCGRGAAMSDTRVHAPAGRRTDWVTPWTVFADTAARYGPFELDAAAQHHNAKVATYYTPEMNGLNLPWINRTFVNPPFGAGAARSTTTKRRSSTTHTNWTRR